MGLKEKLRNATAFITITAASLYCGQEDTAQEVTFTPRHPTPTPTPERQVTRPSPTLEATPTPTPASTPESTLIPTALPIPQTREPVIVPTSAIEPQPSPPPAETLQGLNHEAALKLFELANQARAANGLPLLSWNSSLKTSAEKYATFLVTNGLYGHCYDGSPHDRAEREGYMWGVGEILGAGDSPEIIFERFMSSPGHRDWILRADARDNGFGYYKGQFTSLVLGEFGIPGTPKWPVC